MRVLWITVLLTFLTIAVEAKNGWQKGKGSWHKHKGGEDGYHKHPDGEGNSNGTGGNEQGTNGNGGNGQNNGQDANGNGGNGQGTNGGNGNGQGTNGNNENGQGTNEDGNGKDPRPTPSRAVSDNPEEAFHDLARQVVADDNIVSKYCEKNQVKGATEIYGPDYYQLIIPVQDDDADWIEVKIKHRVIYIKAEVPDINERWSGDDDHHLNYIKVLPHFLDITRIRWDINNLKLITTIPYKFKFNTQQPVACDKQNDPNAKEIIVPRGGISRGPPDLTTILPKPQRDEEVTTTAPIDPNILDKIFGRK
ncbi:hypothetical protein O0L34_g9789 [Tuta absoluta]|nr:hypothetical protein O0L34_g9789 [Tuta absoluta]